VTFGAERFPPAHFRSDGSASQDSAENRLLRIRGFGDVTGSTLFPEVRADALEEALSLQAERFVFRLDPASVDRW
jgi:hypothetical protein